MDKVFKNGPSINMPPWSWIDKTYELVCNLIFNKSVFSSIVISKQFIYRKFEKYNLQAKNSRVFSNKDGYYKHRRLCKNLKW